MLETKTNTKIVPTNARYRSGACPLTSRIWLRRNSTTTSRAFCQRDIPASVRSRRVMAHAVTTSSAMTPHVVTIVRLRFTNPASQNTVESGVISVSSIIHPRSDRWRSHGRCSRRAPWKGPWQPPTVGRPSRGPRRSRPAPPRDRRPPDGRSARRRARRGPSSRGCSRPGGHRDAASPRAVRSSRAARGRMPGRPRSPTGRPHRPPLRCSSFLLALPADPVPGHRTADGGADHQPRDHDPVAALGPPVLDVDADHQPQQGGNGHGPTDQPERSEIRPDAHAAPLPGPLAPDRLAAHDLLEFAGRGRTGRLLADLFARPASLAVACRLIVAHRDPTRSAHG